MNDFREYQGIDFSPYFLHYGVGHLQGGHSGRFPWGSGENGGGATRSARDRYKTAKTNYRTAKKALRSAENRRDVVNNSELSTTSDKRTAQRDVLRRERALDKAEVEFKKEQARYKESRSSAKEERRQNREAFREEKRQAKEAESEAKAAEKAKEAEERPHKLLSMKLNRSEDKLDNISNKDIGKLTDKELNDRINRLRQEDTYRQLLGQKTLSQLRKEKDKPKEIAKDALENLVRVGLRDLVNKVIVPTATGHLIYTLSKGKNDEANAAIKKYNEAHPDDKKALFPDVDYLATVFKDARRVQDQNGGKKNKNKKNNGDEQDQQQDTENGKKNKTSDDGNNKDVKSDNKKTSEPATEKPKTNDKEEHRNSNGVEAKKDTVKVKSPKTENKEEYHSWNNVDKDREKVIALDPKVVNSRNEQIARLFDTVVESTDIKNRTLADVPYGIYSSDRNESRYGTKMEVPADGYINNGGSNYTSTRLRGKDIREVKRAVTMTVNSSSVKDMTLRDYNEAYPTFFIDPDDEKRR